MINPFLQKWNTPFGSPPFDKIDISHYKPAITKAITISIRRDKGNNSDNPEPPDFDNTIAALEKSGETSGK